VRGQRREATSSSSGGPSIKAARYNHPNILRCAIDNGCPFDDAEVCAGAARSLNLEMLTGFCMKRGVPGITRFIVKCCQAI
jgi:hypothetical protein